MTQEWKIRKSQNKPFRPISGSKHDSVSV